MHNFLSYFVSNLDTIIGLFFNHIQYSFISILLAILIGVPLGIIIFNYKTFEKPVLSIANLIQAVPSLAVLGFIVPYLGIGASTAIFMVVLYSLLPILKNTYAGLSSINKDTIEAARGIGMTRTQVLTKVQIPLALPVIMAGIRISSVTAVGLMTIAAYIGADVLGTLVISGIQVDNANMILSGAIPACVLALTTDFVMSKVEKAVTPVSLQLTTANLTNEKIEQLKQSKKFTFASLTAAFIAIVLAFGIQSARMEPDIVVGSKEATEGKIVGYFMSTLLKEKTDLVIEERMGLGGSSIAYSAIKTGEIDIYPDYAGTLYIAIFEQEFIPGTPQEKIMKSVEQSLYENGNLFAADSFDVNNTYVLAVRKDTAEKYNLKTISDLAKVSSSLLLGGTPEFNARQDGLLGLQDAYGLKVKDAMQFSGSLLYTAIDSKQVDIISAFSTDSLISKYDLVVLEDDLNFFPPYNLFPVINSNVYYEYPEALEVLNEYAPMLTDDVMRKLNGQVVELGMEPKEVAVNFLKEQGIID